MSPSRKCYLKKFLILTALQIIINVGTGKNVAADVTNEDLGQSKEQIDTLLSSEEISEQTEEETSSISESSEENSNQLEEVTDNEPKTNGFIYPLEFSQELREKIELFRYELDKQVESKYSGRLFNSRKAKFKVEVRRSNILEDSFKCIRNASYRKLMAKKFRVDFKGEENYAEIAAPKEWLTHLSDEIFNPKSKYFKYTDENRNIYTLQIRPMKIVKSRDEKFFYFVGRVIGIAIYRGYRIHVYLSKLIYKKILGKEIELNDVKDVDPDFYKGLLSIMENDQSSSNFDFEVEEEDEFENKFSHNLNPLGKPLNVDESNKTEFVRLYIQWKFAPEKQTAAFLRGLDELVPLNLLRERFNEKELELLLCGVHELNVEEWKESTYVQSGAIYSSSKFLEWFWEIVQGFSNDKRAKLLEYATGSRSLLVGGFKALDRCFTIELLGPVDESTDNVIPPPEAHTCSSKISLPIYKSQETLKQQLEMIVEEPLKYNTI